MIYFEQDFALPGFRAGVIHTKNKEFLSVLRVLAAYQATPSIVHQALSVLINDIGFYQSHRYELLMISS